MAFLFRPRKSYMAKNIIIVSNGRFGNFSFFKRKISMMENRLIICCDGAANHLRGCGIKPDLIIGDMDSLEVSIVNEYEIEKVEILKYPANKDFTDTELALDYAFSLKPAAVYIWGALGGRIDHILANVCLLTKAGQAGINVRLIDEYCEAFIARENDAISDAIGCTVSLLSLSDEVCGISLTGFAYPLNKENLRMGQTRGVSNIIMESPAVVEYKSGVLLIIRYWMKDLFPEVTK